MRMIPLVIEEIRRLSQDEGLYDREIGERLGISRLTVHRARSENAIPTANTDNRKDKAYKCLGCTQTVIIRRHERRTAYCPACTEKMIREENKKNANLDFAPPTVE